VLAIAGPQRDVVLSRLPPDAIAETIGELACAIVPDPEGPGRHAELQRAVTDAGARAGLGIAVGWPEAAASLHRARAALALGDSEPGLVSAREHAGELMLRSDPLLAAELLRATLAPLEDLTAAARARLTETLAVWLAEQGRPGAVAARLGIHPQTARYRIARLRELFGERLDDAEQRFWLEVALRISAD